MALQHIWACARTLQIDLIRVRDLEEALAELRLHLDFLAIFNKSHRNRLSFR